MNFLSITNSKTLFSKPMLNSFNVYCFVNDDLLKLKSFINDNLVGIYEQMTLKNL